MSTAVAVPENPHSLRQDRLPGKPPENRAKIDDLDLDDSREDSSPQPVNPAYCEICAWRVGHTCWDCPDYSKAMGLTCRLCHGPCKKKNDPDYDPVAHRCAVIVKQCLICGKVADHWADDCPYRSDTEDDCGASDYDDLGL